MKADLTAAARRERVLRYASYGLMVLSPFLLLGVLSLILGRSALDSWPVWTDELDYWRSLQNWNAVGFATGYSGLSEIVPEAGTLSVHGLTAIVFYGWFVKLFGLSHNTIVLCNALWVSLGALLFCLLLKPKPLTCVYISVLLATYAPVVLYAFTSMTQLCQYGVLLIYLAFLLRYARNRKPGWLFLSLVSVVLMCCFRINYLLLVLPVAWVCGGGKKLCLKTVLFSLLGLCLVIGVYLLTSQWSAPYAQGFPYALSQAGSFALMVRMLMSHFKANLIGFFAFYRYSPILWWFRVFYLAMLALCLFKAFLQVRKDGKGLKLGLNAASVWCFLWLASALGIVLLFNDVNAWTDFHILAPMLWLIPVYLICREKKLLPALALAGSLALTVFLCFQPPMGAYADPDRFDPPAANESLSTAMSYITYDPAADDPFDNTVRTDLSGERLLMELDEGLGLQYGWFTPDSLGKSRWILTDTLKVALEGYEQVYSTHGAAVYRKTEAPKEP